MKRTIKLKKKQSRNHNVRKDSSRRKSRKTKKLYDGGNGPQRAVQTLAKNLYKHAIPLVKIAAPATTLATTNMIPGNMNYSFSNIPEKHRFVHIAQPFHSHPKNELEGLLKKNKNHTGDDKYNYDSKFKTDFTKMKSPLSKLEEQFKNHIDDLIPEKNDERSYTYNANEPTINETIRKEIDQTPLFSQNFDIEKFNKELIIDEAHIHTYVADKNERINNMLPNNPTKPNEKSLIKILFKGLDPTFLTAIKNTLTFELSHGTTGIFTLLRNVYAGKFGAEYTESLLIVLTPVLDAVLNDIAEGALSNQKGGELGTISKALGIEMNSDNIVFKEMCAILNEPIKEVAGIIHTIVKKEGFKIDSISKELSSKQNSEKLQKIKDKCVNTLGDKLLNVVATELNHAMIETYKDITNMNVKTIENKLSGLKDKIKEKVEKAYDLFMDDTISIQTILYTNLYEVFKKKTQGQKIKIGDFVMDENGEYTNDAWLNTTVKIIELWIEEKQKNPDLPTVIFVLDNLDLSLPTLIDDLCNKLNGKGYCQKQIEKSIEDFKSSIQMAPEVFFTNIKQSLNNHLPAEMHYTG